MDHYHVEYMQMATESGAFDTVSRFFSQSGFMPHNHCYLKKPSLVWTMFTTDLLIGLAYVSLSITLWTLIKKIQLPFNLIVFCFSVFILACGMTHLMEVWTLWNPDYWISATVKGITAFASVGTAIYLYQLWNPIVNFAEDARLSEQRRLKLEALTGDLEKHVTERTQRLQLALDATNLGTWEYDPTTNIVSWDERSDLIFGIPPGAFDGSYETFHHYVHPEDRDRVRAAVEATVKNGQDYFQEYRIKLTNGGIRWISARGRLLYDSTNQVHIIIGTALDITESKKYEMALTQAVRARDEFLSIASHELKTPLTSLTLQTQLRKKSLLKGNSGFAAHQINDLFDLNTDARQLERLNRLIDDMLDISRISTGNFTLIPENFNLHELFKDILERNKSSIEIANCEIHLKNPSSSIVGNWDRFRIEQVFTNLLTNALRYSPGKPILIGSHLHSPELVRFTIQDSGMGIAPENHERIFERFERAISANEMSGLGLGLYIAKQIVEMHQGKIWVESALHQGATFIVELPLFPVFANKGESDV